MFELRKTIARRTARAASRDPRARRAEAEQLLIESATRGILKAHAQLLPLIDLTMSRCPYCARPLKGLGLNCRACRRYLLRWPHLLVLSVALLVAVLALLELLLRTH